MSKGVKIEDKASSRVATIDKEYKNKKGFSGFEHIKRFKGDSLSPKMVEKTADFFSRPIDLIFIDTIHDYKNTKKNIIFYGRKLNPRYIILDDTHLNPSMEKLWTELKEKFKGRIFDVTKIGERGKAGMGIIKWRK